MNNADDVNSTHGANSSHDTNTSGGTASHLPRVSCSALQLSVDERAELAAELLASLDGEPDADVEAAWAAEIERRARRVRRESSRGRSWEQVRGDLRRRT